MDLTSLNIIVAAIAGAVGGLAVGSAIRSVDLGLTGNTVTGAVGGLAGSMLGTWFPTLQQIGAGALNGNTLGASALGGLIVTAIVGMLTDTGA